MDYTYACLWVYYHVSRWMAVEKNVNVDGDDDDNRLEIAQVYLILICNGKASH